MKQLIINADDYGYTPGVSEGIRRAHREGIVTSTSVMMPMPDAREALEVLKSEAPSLGIGVHLTLTEGVPFCLDGFPFWKELPPALERIPSAALRNEWRAQIEAFLATGLPLSHLDSHHHAAYRHEKALSVLLELAQKYGVPVRNPYPIAGLEERFSASLFATAKVRHPKHFLDVFDQIVPSLDSLFKATASLEEGLTEFMVHPGIVDKELRRLCPNFAEPRARELAVLTEPRLGKELGGAGIELVSYAAVKRDA